MFCGQFFLISGKKISNTSTCRWFVINILTFGSKINSVKVAAYIRPRTHIDLCSYM